MSNRSTKFPLRLATVAVAVSVIAVVVAATPQSEDALNVETSRNILVAAESGRLPRSCGGPAGVARILISFTDAVSRGDRKRVRRLTRDLLYYSFVEIEGQRTLRWVTFRRQPPLLRYLAKRHRFRERMHPVVVHATRLGGALPHAAGFAVWLVRSADDLGSLGIHHPIAYAKGYLDCRRRIVGEWRMAMIVKAPFAAPYWPYMSSSSCPIPTGWKPSQATVACG